MLVEEGELLKLETESEYKSEYEWPGDDDDPPAESQTTPPSGPSPALRPTLRLLVLHSLILPQVRRLAILEGYTEIQIGRDAPSSGTDTPRLRLKELAVSKLHATVYWDAGRLEWAIVDMGSKHGTFLASEGAPSLSSAANSAAHSARLSAPRIASVPRRLRHLDRLTLGGTTFIIHIHESGLPCDQCSASSRGNANEIPLFATDKPIRMDERVTEKRKRSECPPAASNSGRVVIGGRDARKALTSLKRNLLNRHGPSVSSEGGATYVDRAARRRALHPSSGPDQPIPPIKPMRQSTPPIIVPASATRPPSPIRSAPPVPLAASNIGHQLLLKQGWKPGSTLGSADDASGGSRLLVPLDVTPLPSRAGLGMSAPR